MYHTFSHITFLGYNHMHSRASVFLDSLLSEHISSDDTCVLGEGSFLVTTHGFSSRGGCCCQGKEVVPVDHIRGKGLSSRLTSGSKIRLTAGFQPCPQGLSPSSLAAAHSPFQRVPCFVHSIPVLAASHSSLAQRHHILRRTLLQRGRGGAHFVGTSSECPQEDTACTDLLCRSGEGTSNNLLWSPKANGLTGQL